MARSNNEDIQSFNQHFQSGRFSHSRKTLGADALLTKNGSLVNFFDPDGVDRDVTLPALEEGRFYVVANIGSANNIVVRNEFGTLVTSLLPNDTALMFASDAEWVALRGWAALGIFTNTVNGLVPAPNSVTPGSLFLRDDGQWAQVQVVGIVDAFKFITDGVNTAIGSGPDTFWLRSSTNKIGITVTNGEAVFGDNANFTVNEANVDHDLLLNWFADEHVGHSTVVLTAGTGLSGGGDITTSRTFDLDLNDLTTVAPVLGDTFAFYDISGTTTSKATLTTLNGILNHNALLNYVADQHVAHSGVSIVTAAASGLSGGGDITTSRSLALDINGMTSDTPALGDSVAIYDTSGGDHNKSTLTQLNAIFDHNSLLNYVANQHIDHTAVTFTAGTGLTGGGTIAANRTFNVGSGVGIIANADDVALNFNGLTTQTVATGDIFAYWDISASTHSKATFSALNAAFDHDALLNFVANEHIDHTAVSIATGLNSGLTGGGTIAATRNLSLDINALTADATPDSASDYIVTWDASASLHKKVLIANLPGGLNIVGLTEETSIDPTADFVVLYDASAAANRKALVKNLGREVLKAARTYYVRTDGVDSNTGLVDSSGGAFLTIQKAIDIVSSLDMSIYQVTILVRAGTYTAGMNFRNWLGALRPIIEGDTTTPANVIISTAGHCVSSDGSMGWTVQGFRLTSSGGQCINAENAGAVYFGACDIHTASSIQIWAKSASTITCISGYNITGNSTVGIHFAAADGGVFYNTSATINIPSAIACATAFALAARNGTLYNTGTISGAGVAGSTGPRYAANLNGVIYVGGSGANYFPGNSAGSTATGGQYA